MRTLLVALLLFGFGAAEARQKKPPKIKYGMSREEQIRKAEKARRQNDKRNAAMRSRTQRKQQIEVKPKSSPIDPPPAS